jgi:hypothetical protein
MTNFFKIAPFAGGKIIKAHDSLIQTQQMLQQIGANKTGNTGYQPRLRLYL